VPAEVWSKLNRRGDLRNKYFRGGKRGDHEQRSNKRSSTATTGREVLEILEESVAKTEHFKGRECKREGQGNRGLYEP